MDEVVFGVDAGGKAVRAAAISLAEAGYQERRDLQEWVLAHPEVLGPGVLPITFEFDRWRNAAGDAERDRLDVLGLGDDGRLVVVELKRDRAPDTVEMQAIKYAALASRFTPELVIERYGDFLASRGEALDAVEVQARLEAHAGPLDPDVLRQPRIVLVARSFPPVVTASVVWLSEMGLEIALHQIQAYRAQVGEGEGVIVTISRMFPLPDIEEFTVVPVGARARAAERRDARGKQGPVRRLIRAGALADGTELRLVVPSRGFGESVRVEVERWLAERPDRGVATWRNDRTGPLVWKFDGAAYRINDLVQHALVEAAGVTGQLVQGARWWVLPDGDDLATKAAAIPRGFNWDVLHDLLAVFPEGWWATYGDVAQVIGTAPQPLGNHLTNCAECSQPWRFLSANGKVAAKFTWTDPDDTRDPQLLLEAEGVKFVDGVADPDRRLSMDELRALIEE